MLQYNMLKYIEYFLLPLPFVLLLTYCSTSATCFTILPTSLPYRKQPESGISFGTMQRIKRTFKYSHSHTWKISQGVSVHSLVETITVQSGTKYLGETSCWLRNQLPVRNTLEWCCCCCCVVVVLLGSARFRFYICI